MPRPPAVDTRRRNQPQAEGELPHVTSLTARAPTYLGETGKPRGGKEGGPARVPPLARHATPHLPRGPAVLPTMASQGEPRVGPHNGGERRLPEGVIPPPLPPTDGHRLPPEGPPPLSGYAEHHGGHPLELCCEIFGTATACPSLPTQRHTGVPEVKSSSTSPRPTARWRCWGLKTSGCASVTSTPLNPSTPGLHTCLALSVEGGFERCAG